VLAFFQQLLIQEKREYRIYALANRGLTVAGIVYSTIARKAEYKFWLSLAGCGNTM
jgi:hypothetical protein